MAKGKPETFEFLGFTHICAKTRDGRFKLARITSKKRMRAKLREVKTELRRRRHLPIPEQGRWLASVVRGHLALLRRARQRSHGARLPGAGHLALAQGATAPQPALESDLEAHVPDRESMAPFRPHPASTTDRALRRPHPRQEPSALTVHAGICAGGRPQGRSLPRTYATRVRSSRAIERHCRQDVAYRVITGNLVPDHATIARFICRHERALAGLFGEVLKLCDRAGLVKPGVVSIDGTRIAGNASPEVNYQFGQIASEILAEARATDEAEDEAFGEARGDELPEQLRTAEGRREFFRQAREHMRREQASPEGGRARGDGNDEVSLALDANEIVGRGRQGRDAWLREGKRQLEHQRWENPDPISRSRGERLLLSAERLGSDLDVERRANEAYEHYRATARDRLGRRPGGRAEPYRPPEVPAGKVNTTDPDSRPIPIGFGFGQGYNAQAAVNEQQIVLAAEITNVSTDFSQLDPMVTATLARLSARGSSSCPRRSPRTPATGTSSTWTRSWPTSTSRVLIAPDKGTRGTPKRWLTSGRASWMRTVLAADYGHERYRNANRRSSRCSVTPNTTAASTASTGEAGSRCASSGDY